MNGRIKILWNINTSEEFIVLQINFLKVIRNAVHEEFSNAIHEPVHPGHRLTRNPDGVVVGTDTRPF